MSGGPAALGSLHPTSLDGCTEVRLRPHRDARGLFLKTYHESSFRGLGLPTAWPEEFISTSAKGVIRGMHFQAPPHQHAKFVVCLAGRVLDVALDLRAGSPTYGCTAAVELAAEAAKGLFIPAGFAHGFQALEEGSMLLYKVSSMHAPAFDHGIRWDSFGFQWPLAPTTISPRDAAFAGLSEFATPFRS